MTTPALITYEVKIDSLRTGTYAAGIDDVSALVESARFSHGMGSAYDEVAPPAIGAFVLVNHDGRFDVENPAALFYDKLLRGTLVRVRATQAGSATMQLYEGRIKQVLPSLGEGRPRRVTLICECPMNALLQAEYKPEFQENVTADVAIAPIFDNAVITYPYTGTFWLLGIAGHGELGVNTRLYSHDVTDFDTGVTVFEFVGDNLGGEAGLAAQSFIRDYVAAELGGRFFFDARQGRFVFHNRHRDLLNTTVAVTVARQDSERVAYTYGEDVFNKVTLHYRPRDVGAAGTVLWSQATLPITLSENGTRKLNARYRDVSQPSARVGGKDFIEPQPGVDYIANAKANGSGADRTSKIGISAAFGASGAEVTLSNLFNKPTYITTLQLRGTPVTVYDKQFVTAINGTSVGMNGMIEETRQLNALSDPELAQSYADLLVERFGTPAARVERITFDAMRDAVFAGMVVNRSIGERVRLADTPDKDYILVGEEHEILGGASPEVPATHLATWVLRPRDIRYNYWLLGTPGYGELGTATRLAL